MAVAARPGYIVDAVDCRYYFTNEQALSASSLHPSTEEGGTVFVVVTRKQGSRKQVPVILPSSHFYRDHNERIQSRTFITF
jgi:hypothetical protein